MKYQFGLKRFPNEKQILGCLFKILKYVQLFENGLKMDRSTCILKNTLEQTKIALNLSKQLYSFLLQIIV